LNADIRRSKYMLYMVSAYSLLAVYLNCVKEWVKFQLRKERNEVEEEARFFTDVHARKKIFWQSVNALIIPYPFFLGMDFTYSNYPTNEHIIYSVNDILNIVSLIKLMFLLPYFLELTIWLSSSSYRVW
jgi:hypothetical protein